MRRKIFLVFGVSGFLWVMLTGLALADPTTPQTFTATKRSACAMDLAWTARPNSGPTYHVEYTAAPTFFAGGTTVTDTTALSFTHTGLNPRSLYSYRIKSVSADGTQESAWKFPDPPAGATDALPAAPAAPGGFTVTGLNDPTVSANDGKQVDLAWTSGNLSGYGGFVAERLAEGGSWTTAFTAPSTARAGRDDASASLDNTKVYRYRMSAYESAEGCSAVNRNYSASTTEVIVPVRPTNLSSRFVYNPDVNARRVDLAWTAGRGQTFIEILRKGGTGASFTKLPTIPTVLPGSTVSYPDTSVTTNVSYTYKVRGCAASGCSAFSNETSRGVVDAPQNLVAFVKSFTTSGGVVQLTWENTFAGAGNYIVERAEGMGAFSPLPGGVVLARGGTPPPPSVTYDDTSPLSGKSYRYRVRADFGGVEPNRYSAYSNEVSASFNIQPIKGWAWSGHGLGWTRLSNDSVKSSWGDATGAPGESWTPYTVYMEKDAPYYLGGYAWNPYGGWLSFNDEGCPSGYSSCRARVDLTTGAVSGFAKFISDGGGRGLDRWVS
ncbi:MAG: fibronectin type III domain-containing protein, partial [Candidatus Jorgensenbacteria bacterium]